MTKLKDSGIPWIGIIPEHWESGRFKSRFSTRKGLSITKADLTESGIPVISYGQIHSKHNKGTTVTEDIIKYVPKTYLQSDSNALVDKGDFIFADTSEDISGCGNCAYIDCDGEIFGGYHTIIASGGGDNKYFSYLFLTDAWRSQIRCNVTGIKVFSISQAILANTRLIEPSIAEQEAIAAYLDKKCGEIDELIEVEQQMIFDLEAYRQAVISEVVTKGLSQNMDFKFSGYDWIGYIPVNWDVKRLRFIGSTQNGISKEGSYFGSGSPFVNYGDVYNNIFLPKRPINLCKSDKTDQDIYSVKYGDVFFTRTSETIEEIGFSAACLETIDNAVFSGFLIRFRPDARILKPEYAGYYFRSNLHREFFVKEMNIVTRASLGQNLLRNIPVLIPPIEEQLEIADYLDAKCNEIEDLIKVKQEKIETLKQYRQSLIFEAVTGKITIA